MTLVSDYDYELPSELIAQTPSAERGGSRMLVVNRDDASIISASFADLPSFLRSGDGAVFNNTKVMPARLYGIKEPGCAKVELLLVRPERKPGRWRCLAKPGKRVRNGADVRLLKRDGDGSGFVVTVVGADEDGGFIVDFNSIDPVAAMSECGHAPLPPYITRGDEALDWERYQTVYAEREGAVAAPTAGLHFSAEIITKLDELGIERIPVTLHVGPGTFKPVSVERAEDHKMHTESYEIDAAAAARINAVKEAGGRILAVGTTSVRVLESVADESGRPLASSGLTDIFIHPPYRFKAVDMLLTNFHLPKSTLLMLVSAFAGRELIMAAYHRAITERYRFYSYGDCMLIV